jgi:hypothetical protein
MAWTFPALQDVSVVESAGVEFPGGEPDLRLRKG